MAKLSSFVKQLHVTHNGKTHKQVHVYTLPYCDKINEKH